jgi:16S rRNA (cytidine1402-2'-O)-methyltransferase
VVIYEAPHRVRDTLEDLAQRFGGEREIVVARELSKKFEEVARMPLGAAVSWLDERRERGQGEFVLVLAPGEERPAAAVDAERVLDVLLGSLPPSEAAKLAARITGEPKSELYKRALKRTK